jgi:hypothetical protein
MWTADTAVTADPDPAAAAALGLAVFALPPGSKDAPPGWHQRATRNLAELARRWPAGSNIGVSCRASGMVGVDLDRHAGGADGVAGFAALCEQLGESWPDTLTVATPNRGLHLYFRAPPAVPIGSTSGGVSPLGPGIDTRGPGRRTGGYLVGPGSVVDGRRYTVVRAGPIASLPTWLSVRLAERGRTLSKLGRFTTR